jgi:Flp pilus assembly protein TadB
MVSIPSLWLPILLAAVIVFVASSLIHMVLGYHKNDVRKLANEEAVSDAFRALGIPPGDYALPCASSTHDLKDPAFQARLAKGPIVFMTVAPGGSAGMGPALAMWFVYCLVVGVFAAYIAGRALGPGAHYLAVFRFAGATAFLGYSLALVQHSIWYKRSWATTARSVFDGLIFACLTAGTFGWLWPR